MRTFKLVLCLLGLQFTLYSSTIWAVPIANLYNTGLDGSGNYLPTLGLDGNYTVISSPLGSFTPAAVDDTAYPFPSFWVANNPPLSRWIGTSALYSDGPNGNYLYRTTFNLPANANLGSVVVTGAWATDDPGLDILINGISTSQVSAGFSTLVGFSVTSGFNVGLNTLDFLVGQVGGGPTGLRVDDIRGSFSVPEPASFALALLSLGGIIMRRHV